MTAFLNNLVPVLILAAAIVIIFGIIIIVLGVQRISKSRTSVDQRVHDFIENKGTTEGVNPRFRLIPRELSGSFFTRTIKPALQKVVDFFGRFTPANSIAKSNFKLNVAGNPMGIHAQEYYGIRVLFLFVGVLIAILINFRDGFSSIVLMILGAAIILFMLFLPVYWLNSKVKDRQDELRRNLPDALDMLSVCAAAGLGFDQSLKKITEFWETPLSNEFKHMLQDMDIGETRAEALHNMSARVDISELSSFISIIIQAESIGMSFSDVLHSQAKQMRVLRQFRAKEIANSLPAKMIVPVVIFIFPALIAVIIAPIIPTLMNLF
jgi:tight adherence protein C